MDARRPEFDTVKDIHTVSYNKDTPGRPVVCLHGFGSASGIYATSLPVFAAKWNAPVHALDTPGCGLSRRDKAWAQLSSVEAEALVVEALEAWRTEQNYAEMILVAHSIGAVFATAYVEKYPHRVSTLALVSPAGVARLDEKPSHSFRRSIFAFLWPRVDPFSVIQTFPEYGKQMITAYVDRRFRDDRVWTKDIKSELRDYLYENVVAEVSLGGVLLSLLLEPLTPSAGLRPLEDRLRRPDFLHPKTRLAFVYGQRDWMPHAPAHRIQAARHSSSDDPGDVTPIAFVNDGASHNLMVDNPLGFSDALLTILTSSSSPETV